MPPPDRLTKRDVLQRAAAAARQVENRATRVSNLLSIAGESVVTDEERIEYCDEIEAAAGGDGVGSVPVQIVARAQQMRADAALRLAQAERDPTARAAAIARAVEAAEQITDPGFRAGRLMDIQRAMG